MQVRQVPGACQDYEWTLYITLRVSLTQELEIECPRCAGYCTLECPLRLKDLRSGLVARAKMHNSSVLGRGSDKVSLEARRIH